MRRVVGAVLVACATAGGAAAQEVDWHGFGGWAYGRTNDGQEYLGGQPKGDYQTANLNLNVTAAVNQNLKIVGQSSFTESAEAGLASFDLAYAFAEWRFSDRLQLRVGQIKQPFGISSEVFAVGTLRPFFALPLGVYGQVGLVSDSYKGVGLSGNHPLGRWRLNYDVYGGGVDVEEFAAPETFLRGEPVSSGGSIETQSTRNLIGGRAELGTPVDGLAIGASAYTGEELGSTRRTVFGFHGDYERGPWSLRSEYARETQKGDIVVHGFYAEAAYRVGLHWQAAIQYDRLTSSLADVEPVAPSLLEHEELALGLNYWLTRAFVFKLAYHHVDGNRFAGPEADQYASLVAAGQLKRKTDLVQFGAQFSF